MNNIFCLNNIAKEGMDQFTSDYQIVDSIDNANAVMVRSAAMHDMTFPKDLCAIARAGAGVNNIPLDRCVKEGIVVFNTPGANANGVKELVLAGMFLAARDITGGVAWVNENKYDENISKTMEKSKKLFAGTELKGKTLGVIGLGAIGIEVANTAVNLGMNVIGYDPYLSVYNALRLSRQIQIVEKLEPLYAACDYITVHVPLLDATREMINEAAFAQMKDGVVILNYARDLLIDHKAMAAALESGKVKRYMTDFPNTQTADMKNVIATPHLGASTDESEVNCAIMAANELMDFMKTGCIRNSVNFPACSLDPEPCACRICITNVNRPNMITQFTSVLASEGINIPNMANKSRGEAAYTLLDCDSVPSEETLNKLRGIDGVSRVRVIYF